MTVDPAGFLYVGTKSYVVGDNLTFDNGATINNVDGGLWIGSASGNPVPATLSASNGVTVTNGPNSIAISFNPANATDPYTSVNFGMSPYTVLPTDYYISVDSSGGAVTILFPDAPITHKTFILKDRTGNSSTNPITVTSVSGIITFDGQTSIILDSNYVSIDLIFSNPNYEIF